MNVESRLSDGKKKAPGQQLLFFRNFNFYMSGIFEIFFFCEYEPEKDMRTTAWVFKKAWYWRTCVKKVWVAL